MANERLYGAKGHSFTQLKANLRPQGAVPNDIAQDLIAHIEDLERELAELRKKPIIH